MCGARQFAFRRSDTEGDASNLISVQANGDWHIQAFSPDYSHGTLTIEVDVTLEHVDPQILTETFDLVVCIE